MIRIISFVYCRIPNVEDIIDDKFVSEERLQKESAMYKIMNGMFQDPFQDIRPPVIKPKEDAPNEKQPSTVNNNSQSDKEKKKRGRPRTKNIV